MELDKEVGSTVANQLAKTEDDYSLCSACNCLCAIVMMGVCVVVFCKFINLIFL